MINVCAANVCPQIFTENSNNQGSYIAITVLINIGWQQEAQKSNTKQNGVN